jgi:hypothetical protein
LQRDGRGVLFLGGLCLWCRDRRCRNSGRHCGLQHGPRMLHGLVCGGGNFSGSLRKESSTIVDVAYNDKIISTSYS